MGSVQQIYVTRDTFNNISMNSGVFVFKIIVSEKHTIFLTQITHYICILTHQHVFSDCLGLCKVNLRISYSTMREVGKPKPREYNTSSLYRRKSHELALNIQYISKSVILLLLYYYCRKYKF